MTCAKSTAGQRIVRSVALFCVASLSLAANATLAAATESARRPNIILVMTDDQGYGDLACLGNPIIQTPNIDRFYSESVRFSNFHVSPTCSPTRSAIMTGRHEFRNGVTSINFCLDRCT
jgi:arylsulfatase